MKAPIGAMVKLAYDADITVEVGDVLKTISGRCYLLVSVRQQKKGKHTGRWHLKTVVIEKIPENSNVYPIFWYPRKKRYSF